MSNTIVKDVEASLVLSNQVDINDIWRVLKSAKALSCDYLDIFLQKHISESWFLEDGLLKDGQYHEDAGFGLRAIQGEKTAFAYADGISQAFLTQAGDAVSAMLRQHQQKDLALSDRQVKPLYVNANPIESLPDQQKLDLLKTLDAMARACDPRIEKVTVRLSIQYDEMMLLNQLGEQHADRRPLVSLFLRVIAKENGRFEQGSSGFGGRYDLPSLQSRCDLKAFVARAVNQALVNLQSKPSPKGEMPVVLANGWPGILLHEAVGHGLEGDFNRKGTSAFSGRIGERVATEQCTVVDDGTIADRRGSLSIDDEGVASQNTVLIEKGILKGYMQDRHNAHLMKTAVTGNGRRESYAHRPLPRMTNTYMLPGQYKKDEIIQSVKRGVYAVDFAGGQVDITSGQFVFSMSEAYLIENGKITQPLTGATLIGDGPTVMQQISMVADDLALDQGIGTCGKDGQSVPVGVGQPTLKIDSVTVGGR